MIKSILAIVAGNFVWTALWLGFNVILKTQALLPSDRTKPVDRAPALLLLLAASVLFSVGAGYLTTGFAAGGSYGPALVLAFLQLALGIFFQTQAWRLMPIWYRIPFLLLLVPATLAGAWLKLR